MTLQMNTDSDTTDTHEEIIDNNDTTTELELEESVETVEEKPDWVEDHTVPPGYKRRIFSNNIKVHFNIPGVLAPDGRQFKSRQSAVRVMIKLGKSQEDIDQMRACLVHEDWEISDVLPRDWRFKRVPRSEHRSHVQLMSDRGDTFKSLREAYKYAENSDADETLTKLKSFIEKYSLEKRLELYDWRSDGTVPDGWKMRVSDGKTGKLFFLSPDGKMFASRTLGLLHMIKENFSCVELDQMKQKIVEHENWQFNGKLPHGWLIRNNPFSLLTREGDVLESWVSAFDRVKNIPGYSSLDTKFLQQLCDEKCVEKRVDGYSWTDCDSAPAGWKSRRADSKTAKQFFLSPEGVQHSTRLSAYRHLVENKFPVEIQNEMRMFLKYEDWIHHHLLPEGWLYKNLSSDKTFHLLDPLGNEFKSVKTAVEHIRKNSSNAEYEEEKLQAMADFMLLEKRTEACVETKNLPRGWRLRKGKKEKNYLLSPAGVQLPTKKSALIHMIENNYPEEDVDIMRKNMYSEGWRSHRMLPDKWLYCFMKVNSSFQLISSDGIEFKSLVTAREHIEKNYCQEDAEKLNTFAEDETVRRRSSKYSWTKDDQSVPSGWRIRNFVSRKTKQQLTFLLSPGGTQFSNRRTALIHMIKHNYPESDVSAMKKSLLQEDFEEHSLLPGGWLCKYSSNMLLISDDGDTFESFLTASDMMRNNSKYSDRDIENLEKYKLQKLKDRRKSVDSEWNADASLPADWKYKLVGSKQYFLSPEGEMFQGRKLAYQHLLKTKDKVGAEQFRTVLIVEDGWTENKLLPDGWLFKQQWRGTKTKAQTRSFMFITREGLFYESSLPIKEHIEKFPGYNSSDVSNFDRFSQTVLKRTVSSSNKCTNQVKQETKTSSSHSSWRSDPSLPDGWMSRTVSQAKSFKSAQGRVFGSRRSALVHLVTTGAGDTDVEKMRSGFSDEGWSSDHLLPDWWFRVSSHNCLFISPEGELCESVEEVEDIIRHKSPYLIKNLKQFKLKLKK